MEVKTMKNSYPIVLMPDKVGYVVYIPDFDINTEGDSMTEAIEMARDAIGLIGIEMEDRKQELPNPTSANDVVKESESYIVTFVDVDFTEYRKKNDMRAVKKNCTIPSWLNFEAEKAGINFSAVLQAALKKELKIAER
jgi:predicted RNase H-like HicB family nuclease